MPRVQAIVIGGGQAGLAMSRCLTERNVEHVVLERLRIGERWLGERWDGLRLLTPNWMTRLPGWRYGGPDPDGFMTMPEVAAFLASYARSFAAPVEAGTTVLRVAREVAGGRARFRVETDRGVWTADAVVLATGDCDRPCVPSAAAGLSPGIAQVVPSAFRNPDALPPGGVLVVGASATGVQLADALAAAGRPVVLSVGAHTRIPRRWRGRDIFWWLDRCGVLDDPWHRVGDIARARRQPSLQLVGNPDGRSIDLATLAGRGVRLAGRLSGIDGTEAGFAPDLLASAADAERRLGRLLARIDATAADRGLDAGAPPAERPAPIPTDLLTGAPDRLDLAAEGIGSVIWATGFRRAWPWLALPVVGADGEIVHDGGVTAVPGLYVLGLRFLRRRKSSFIDGVGPDAEALAEHLLRHARARSRRAA